MLLQSGQIEFGKLGRPDLPGLEEPREVSEWKERQLLVRGRHGHIDGLPAQRPPLARKKFPRRDRVEDEGRLRVVPQPGVPNHLEGR